MTPGAAKEVRAGTLQTRTIDLGGPLHYFEFGGDGPPMLLVHGLGGSHANWVAAGPLFARRHRVIALDLPGFGRTPLEGRASLERNVDVITRFVDRMFGGPVTLVGNSMGGLLSLMTAATAPDRVRSLVLVNAAHPPARGARLDREVAIAFTLYMIPRVAEWVMKNRAAKMTPEQLVHDTMRICAAEPEKLAKDVIAAHVAIAEERAAMSWAHQAYLGNARAIVRALLAPGRVAKMADRIRAPTLLVHGDRDRLVPLGAARAAAARHHWKLEVFHGVGHVPQIEIPARFVDTVEDWLASLPQ